MITVSQVAKNNRELAARLQFVDWLKTNLPSLYQEAMAQAKSGNLKSLGETPTLWERLATSITNLYGTIEGAKIQKEILSVNLDRAKQGLPPVDASTMAPVVKTQVSVTPEMAAELRAGTNKALMYGGIAAGVVLLLMMSKKR